jgi:hypothetical protein
MYYSYYTVGSLYPANPAPDAELEKGAGRRFSWLAALCVVLLIVAASCVYQGVQAFVDPPATANSGGEIAVGISGKHVIDPNFSDPDAGAPVYVRVEESYRDVLLYEIRFPAAFVSRRFVILLFGDGRLKDVVAEDDDEHTVHLEIGTKPCGPVLCEVLYGTIPRRSASFGVSSRDCANRNNDSSSGVTLVGRGRLLASTDWAHRIARFPGMSSSFSLHAVNTSVTFLFSVPLDGYYNFNRNYGCEQLGFSDDWKATNVSSGARSADDELEWDSTQGLASASAVLQDRNAEAKGNAWIATAAIVAAVAVGFLPIAYEANRVWRRHRRRRHNWR